MFLRPHPSPHTCPKNTTLAPSPPPPKTTAATQTKKPGCTFRVLSLPRLQPSWTSSVHCLHRILQPLTRCGQNIPAYQSNNNSGSPAPPSILAVLTVWTRTPSSWCTGTPSSGSGSWSAGWCQRGRRGHQGCLWGRCGCGGSATSPRSSASAAAGPGRAAARRCRSRPPVCENPIHTAPVVLVNKSPSHSQIHIVGWTSFWIWLVLWSTSEAPMKAAAFSRSQWQPHSFFPQPYPAVVMSGVGWYCGDWALSRNLCGKSWGDAGGSALRWCRWPAAGNLEVMQVAQRWEILRWCKRLSLEVMQVTSCGISWGDASAQNSWWPSSGKSWGDAGGSALRWCMWNLEVGNLEGSALRWCRWNLEGIQVAQPWGDAGEILRCEILKWCRWLRSMQWPVLSLNRRSAGASAAGGRGLTTSEVQLSQ